MKNTADDLRLVKKILRGETEYFSELVARYEDKVYKTCYKFVRNPEDALDLSQEIFIRIYNNLASFKEHSSLSTWIYKISVNVCLNFLRTKNRLVLEDTNDGKSYLNFRESGDNPEKHAESRELLEMLDKNLDRSGERSKKIFLYRLFRGMPFKEIAGELQISPESARMNYFRTRKLLQERLKEYQEGE